nr:hypothetical protein [Tanacetum cinerariifolium]
MDSIISLGQKNTLAEYMILSGANNRPPMLDKDQYDYWKSRMELYMKNRDHGRMILESVEHGPLIWPTVEENDAIRTKKYAELSIAEKIQADCDMKATNIILQVLPADIYSLVIHHRVAKDLWERSKFVTDVKLVKDLHTSNFDQLHAYLEQHELHANEVHIILRFAVPVFSPEDDPIACLNKAMAFLTAVASSRFPSTNNQLRTSSNLRNKLLFKMAGLQCNKLKGDKDNIIQVLRIREMLLVQGEILQVDRQELLNVITVKTEHLDKYDSDYDDLLTAQAVLMANISNYGSNVISEENANKEQNKESITAELERYKERVKTFKQRLNIDLSSREKMIDSQMANMIKEKLALKEKVDSLDQNLSKQIKQKEGLLETFNVFQNKSKEKENKYMENEIDLEKKIKELDNIVYKVGQSAQIVNMLTKPQSFYDNVYKQALGYQNPFYLKKAQRMKPTLYDGIVISEKHVAMPVIDDEETLILQEEKLSAEQDFWLRISNPIIESSSTSLVKVEVPSELPKVSLVNESLKKLKFQFAQFDFVVKKRTTPNALTEGEWGFEHTKVVFNNEIVLFLNYLQNIFNVFEKDLLNEITEVKAVFDQMEAVVQQSSVDKQCLEIANKELILENDQLSQQIMSQDIVSTAMNCMSLNVDCMNEKLALKEKVDSLDQNLSKQIKQKEGLLETFNVFQNKSKEKENKYMENEIDLEKKIKELDNIVYKVGQSAQIVNMLTKPQSFYDNVYKQALGYQNPFYLKKAQRMKPTLYDGIVISEKHVAMPVIDDEETLILQEEKLSAEQDFWLRISNPIIESSSTSLVKVEVPSELPKVSLVNESLKKLKFQFAQFDFVVKKRTTPNALTEGEWGFEHTKVVFNNEIVLFLNYLQNIFNVFEKDLLNEITEVKAVFDQMEAVVQQSSVDKHCLEIANKELILENDQLSQQIMSQDIVSTAMNCMSLNVDCMNVGKSTVDNAAQIPSATTVAPGMFKLNLEPLASKLVHNRESHIYYLNYTQEQADILRGIVEHVKAKQPLDNALDFS